MKNLMHTCTIRIQDSAATPNVSECGDLYCMSDSPSRDGEALCELIFVNGDSAQNVAGGADATFSVE